MGRRIIGYGCLSNGILKGNRESILANSKVKQSFVEMRNTISGLFIPEENIEIDILTGNRRSRKKLDMIIHELTSDPETMFDQPRGTIVIPSIKDLGNSSTEVLYNFDRIVPLNIGLLVADSVEFSTVDYSFHYYSDIQIRIKSIRNSISQMDGNLSRRGRPQKKTPITPDFKKVYWLYENYFIPENVALTNSLTGIISRSSFYRLCRDYEESPEYENDEKHEYDKHSDLIEKPKRYGTIPKNFSTLVEMHLDQQVSLHDACRKLNITEMTELTFQRLYNKFTYGKSLITTCVHKYTDKELSSSLVYGEDLSKFNL